eukprot:scaffold21211_cov135-Skeletonema_dohrnii-CCMP3373.AAC.1
MLVDCCVNTSLGGVLRPLHLAVKIVAEIPSSGARRGYIKISRQRFHKGQLLAAIGTANKTTGAHLLIVQNVLEFASLLDYYFRTLSTERISPPPPPPPPPPLSNVSRGSAKAVPEVPLLRGLLLPEVTSTRVEAREGKMGF